MKRILFITTSQLAINPRLRKSASAHVQAGYKVHVLYYHISLWADKEDLSFLEKEQWTAERVGGHPETDWFRFFKSRLLRKLHELLGNYEKSHCRSTSELEKKAKLWRPDLIIGHNPGTIATLTKLHHQMSIPVIFDAEDFHRGEYAPNHSASLRVKKLENTYLPHIKWLTAASPMIEQFYKELYPHLTTTTVNNAFSLSYIVSKGPIQDSPLSLVWFSQTVGLDRGLSEFLNCLSLIPELRMDFTIIGNRSKAVELAIRAFFVSDNHHVSFMDPVSEDGLFELLSTHDLGLALELSNPVNRNICRTNKLYSYPLSGCSMLLSRTASQEQFHRQFPACGKLIDLNNSVELATILTDCNTNLNQLRKNREKVLQLAKKSLNWELEQLALLDFTSKALKG